MDYDYFISYSRQEDSALAVQLEERMRRVGLDRRESSSRRIFRDDSNLAVSEDLGSDLTAALASAKRLVVLLSDSSRTSTWVLREVQTWKAVHDQPIFVLDLGGVAADTELDTELRSSDHHAVDLSWWDDELHGRLREARLDDAAAQIVANLDGVSPEEIRSRTRANNARRRARLLAGSIVLFGATIGLLIAAFVAVDRASTARTSRNEAVARSLAEQAIAIEPEAPRLSALLAVEAHRRWPSPETESAVVAGAVAAHRTRWVDLAVSDAVVRWVDVSSAGRVVVAREDGSVTTWEPDTGAVTVEASLNTDLRAALVDGEQIRVVTVDGTLASLDVGGSVSTVDIGLDGSIRRAELFAPDVVVVGTTEGSVALVGRNGSRIDLVENAHPRGVTAIEVVLKGSVLVTSGADGTIRRWDFDRDELSAGFVVPNAIGDEAPKIASDMAVSADGRVLAVASTDGTVRSFSTIDGSPVTEEVVGRRTHGFGPTRVIASGSDSFISFGADGRQYAWDARTGFRLDRIYTLNRLNPTAVYASPDGTLVTGDVSGLVRYNGPTTRDSSRRTLRPPWSMSVGVIEDQSFKTWLSTTRDSDLVLFGDGAEIAIWSVSRNEVVRRVTLPDLFLDATLDPSDGSIAASLLDGRLLKLTVDGSVDEEAQVDGLSVALDFDVPTGQFVAVNGRDLIIWRPGYEVSRLRRAEPHQGLIVTYSLVGESELVLADRRGQLERWKIGSDPELVTSTSTPLRQVGIQKIGGNDELLVVSTDGIVERRDIKTLQLTSTRVVPFGSLLGFADLGEVWLAVQSDGSLRLYDPISNRPLGPAVRRGIAPVLDADGLDADQPTRTFYADGEILQHEYRIEELVDIICDRQFVPLSEAEWRASGVEPPTTAPCSEGRQG